MAITNKYSPVYNTNDTATYLPRSADNKFFTPERPTRTRSISDINNRNPAGVVNNYRGLYGNQFGADSQFSNAEQTVLMNMAAESISANGITIRYMPRRAPPGVGVDTVFNEIPESQFDTGFSIDSWIQNIEGFEGNTVISLYGLEIREEVDMIISVSRFKDIVQPYDYTVYQRGDSEYVRTRPLEGDIIAIPFGISATGDFEFVANLLNQNALGHVVSDTPQYFPKLFEVLRVSTFQDGPFFQLGGNTTFKLHCRLFELAGETINFDSRYSDYPPNDPTDTDSTVQFILDTLRAYDSEGNVPLDDAGAIDIVNKNWGDRFGRNKEIEESAQAQDVYTTYDSEIGGKIVTLSKVAYQNQVIAGDYGKVLHKVPGIINQLKDI